jgi:GTP-binding protein
LVDVNVPPQASDRQLLDFLESSGRPLVIVATKSDRLSGNQLAHAVRTMAQEYPRARIVPYSARTAAGREELWQQIKVETENYVARL